MKSDIFNKEDNNLKHKIILMLQPNKSNKKGSLNKLIYNFQELQFLLNSLKIQIKNLPKFIYDNMNNIHNILYNSEAFINLNSIEIRQEINNYFYISLLIAQNQEIVNYTYSIDFIKQMINLNQKIKEKKFRKIILCKNLLDIIKNYEALDDYDEDMMEETDKIKEDCIKTIKENIGIFNDLKIKIKPEYIINNKIDNLYNEIINGLIKSKKIDDYEYTYKLIEELELENIYLTNSMFDNIYETLNNKEYINYYKISNIKDLLNEKKINFFLFFLNLF